MYYPHYDPKLIEPAILAFWEKNRSYAALKKKTKRGTPFYFLDGPPYTSGSIHRGPAWNKALKDLFLRHKRMRGFNVWDRAGYDMHGLPIEHATEKKLGIHGSDQIRSFGVDRFVLACKELCTANLKKMNEEFIRLGVWMGFEDAYQSITRDFIDGEWWLIKRAHEQGRLYEGLRTMHWDAASGTSVAKHELEYKQVADPSVYLKLAVKGRQREYLLVWTTTPWTLPFNLAVMAHPDLEYVKASVGDETWILAKALAEKVIRQAAGKEYRIISTFKGRKLEGAAYLHPFREDIPAFTQLAANPKLHTVILSTEYVDGVSGTGIVHTAPGCGPEDYEVGHRNGLPPFNTVDEKGVVRDCGPFTGLRARKDDAQFTEKFEGKGAVVALQKYTHDYPHDWRSHQPVIFRTTRQWFFRVEDLRQQMIEANRNIRWVPTAGFNAFSAWLEHLRDNSISKQRFWGTPLPIWRNVDDADDYLVVGSLKELEKLARTKIKEPHKPWIDEVTITKNGKTYRRVPDVLDVWVDAGTASWNCLGFPKEQKLFRQLFPPEFILEGKDQIRGWFNLLMVAGFLALGKPSFKAVYMHGFVSDVAGVKMSKSLGNVISPSEAIEKHGADALRLYLSQTAAGEDSNFSWKEVALKQRNLQVLWNIHKFVLELQGELAVDPFRLDAAVMGAMLDVEERFIFSKLHHVLAQVTERYEQYRLDEAIAPVEELFLELSRMYIQLVREKGSVGPDEERQVVLFTVAHVLLGVLKLLAPAAPFITEAIYQNLREACTLKEESIHHYSWPEPDSALVNEQLEQDMAVAQGVMQAVAHAREQAGINVRWPLKEALVVTGDAAVAASAGRLQRVIAAQANVKQLTISSAFPAAKEQVRIDFEKISPRYRDLTPRIIAHFATLAKEAVLAAVRKDGMFRFTLDGKEVQLTQDDLLIEQEVAYPYAAAVFGKGSVYINQERTDELEAEGFSRELMRRVQALRKKAGLQKSDRIVLYVQCGDELKEMLAAHAAAIQQKVGASKLKIDTLAPARKHEHVSEEKLRDEAVNVFFDKG